MTDIVAPIAKTGIQALVGQRMHRTSKFVGTDVKIFKLTVKQVKQVQDLAANQSDDGEGGLEILRTVIRLAVEGADVLTDADFEEFPIDELSKLSNDIMEWSGIGQDQGKSA